MQNEKFQIEFDAETGAIQSLILQSDVHQMNFVKSVYRLNQMKLTRRAHELNTYDMRLVSFVEKEAYAEAVFRADNLEVQSEYQFGPKGNLIIRNRIRSLSDKETSLARGEWGIAMAFADEYPNAVECMTNRCHTHLWCGKEGASYICCLKMGDEPDNLGIIATKGGWESYSQLQVATNNRGCFLVHPDLQMLESGVEYEFTYEIFPCTGKQEFQQKCLEYDNYIQIEAKQYTLFQGETIELQIRTAHLEECKVCVVYKGDRCELPLVIGRETGYVEFRPEKTGEYTIQVCCGKVSTYAAFLVVSSLKELLKKRVQFLIHNQQYYKEGSALDGAYLIYDNEEERCFYRSDWPDLNASRERVGMGILVAAYLRHEQDEEAYQSLLAYERFIRREIYNEETGQIYDEIGRGTKNIRLYNFLWVALFYTELFYVTKDKNYLADVYNIIKCYYAMGGFDHYPNAVFLSDFLQVLKENNMEMEYQKVWQWFQTHIAHILENGCDYPKHEVNYEQTIVSPAVALLLDAYAYSHTSVERQQRKEVLFAHMKRLERFDGFAPHYKLQQVAIRFWDGFWFGKSRLFGDTFPHYWSCLSSINYYRYGALAEDSYYKKIGEMGLRNCLCLFFEDGRASCASMFPYMSNGRNGEYYDAYGNDQDFALYFAWRFLGEKEQTEI